MIILLTLFFVSLAIMVWMVGRKIVLVRSGKIIPKDELVPLVPDLPTIKQIGINSTKTIAYIGIVVIIRLYVQLGNFIKAEYGKIKTNIQSRWSKPAIEKPEEENKKAKFLKIVSDYKRKIRVIKYQIVKEEKNK